MQVVARVTEGLSAPERLGRARADGTLRLSSSCPGFFGGKCDVDYDIRVPAGTLVRRAASAGDVVAEDLTRTPPLELALLRRRRDGDRRDRPVADALEQRGRRRGARPSADGVARDSSAGDVTLSLRTPRRELLADSSAGDVEVLVPDAVYRIDASSSAGDVDDRGACGPTRRSQRTITRPLQRRRRARRAAPR